MENQNKLSKELQGQFVETLKSFIVELDEITRNEVRMEEPALANEDIIEVIDNHATEFHKLVDKSRKSSIDPSLYNELDEAMLNYENTYSITQEDAHNLVKEVISLKLIAEHYKLIPSVFANKLMLNKWVFTSRLAYRHFETLVDYNDLVIKGLGDLDGDSFIVNIAQYLADPVENHGARAVVLDHCLISHFVFTLAINDEGNFVGGNKGRYVNCVLSGLGFDAKPEMNSEFDIIMNYYHDENFMKRFKSIRDNISGWCGKRNLDIYLNNLGEMFSEIFETQSNCLALEHTSFGFVGSTIGVINQYKHKL